MGDNMHTPAPWTTGGYTIKARNGSLLVAKLYRNQEPTDAESDANARLISAAPDMLTAIKEIVALLKLDCFSEGVTDEEWIAEVVGSSSPTAEREAAALRGLLSSIAKAEGRS